MKLLRALLISMLTGFMGHQTKPLIDSVFADAGMTALLSHSAGLLMFWPIAGIVGEHVGEFIDKKSRPVEWWIVTGALAMLTFGIGNLTAWIAFDAGVRQYLTGKK